MEEVRKTYHLTKKPKNAAQQNEGEDEVFCEVEKADDSGADTKDHESEEAGPLATVTSDDKDSYSARAKVRAKLLALKPNGGKFSSVGREKRPEVSSGVALKPVVCEQDVDDEQFEVIIIKADLEEGAADEPRVES